MHAKASFICAATALSLALMGCSQSASPTSNSNTASTAASSTTTQASASTTDGWETLDKLIAVSGTSIPDDGTAYTTSVAMEEATPELLMAENVVPHAGSEASAVDTTNAVTITLNDSSASLESSGSANTNTSSVNVADGLVTITSGGTYILTGDFVGQVLVEAAESDAVVLVLDGVAISNPNDAAIRIASAQSVTVYLQDGTTSSLSDASSYAEDADGPSAALASSVDMTIAGTGTLNVSGNGNDGISSSDGLVILSGTINVEAYDDGIRGKDYLVIAGGSLTITAGGDGLKTSNEDDPGTGYVLITGGTFSVSAESQSIDAVSDLIFIDGTFTTTHTKEGFEAGIMLLAGGVGNITSTDDGLNATDADSPYIVISGGTWTLVPSGDGIDSNGSALLSGGTVYVWGPTTGADGSLDTDAGFTITGGTLFTADSGEMTEAPQSSSSQAAVIFTTNSSIAAGTEVSITDADGTTLDTVTLGVNARCVIYSSPSVTSGESYNLVVDDEVAATATAGEYQTMGGFGAGGPGGFGGPSGTEGTGAPSGPSGADAAGRPDRGDAANGTPPSGSPQNNSSSINTNSSSGTVAA